MRRQFLTVEIIKTILACILAVLMFVSIAELRSMEDRQIVVNNPKQETPSMNFVIYIKDPNEYETEGDVYIDDIVDIQEEERLGDMELVAQMVQAEAGNQDLKGKRLVADVIYNRVDDEWADNVEDVIFQRLNGIPQFSSISDGNFNRAGWNVSEESFIAARLEYDSKYRLDNDVLYFCARHYNPSGTPGYKYQDHYFSYEWGEIW